MRLTFLGSAASYPGGGEACAGYLLSTPAAKVLLDCGNGVISNLGRVMDPTLLDAVFVTHAHIDHFADIYALQSALRYRPEGPADPLRLYVPEGLFERMGTILTDRGAEQLAEAFDVTVLVDGIPVRVGDVTVTPHAVEHVAPTFALVADTGGERLCYTSDCRLTDSVVRAATGAAVLLADATLPVGYEGRAPHMTPVEAATLAARAGASTLVMTHLWPSIDRPGAVDTARQHFNGRIMVANELGYVDIDGEEAADGPL